MKPIKNLKQTPFSLVLNPHGSDETLVYFIFVYPYQEFLTHTVQMKLTDFSSYDFVIFDGS